MEDESKYFFITLALVQRMGQDVALEIMRNAGLALGATITPVPGESTLATTGRFMTRVFACSVMHAASANGEYSLSLRMTAVPPDICKDILPFEAEMARRVGCEYAVAVFVAAMRKLGRQMNVTWVVREDVLIVQGHV